MIETTIAAVRKASYDGCFEDSERLVESIVQENKSSWAVMSGYEGYSAYIVPHRSQSAA